MHFLNRRKKCLWLFVISCKLQSKTHFTVPRTITPPWTSVVHVHLVKDLSSKAKHLFGRAAAALIKQGQGAATAAVWCSGPRHGPTARYQPATGPSVNSGGLLHVARHLPSPAPATLAWQHRQAV